MSLPVHILGSAFVGTAFDGAKDVDTIRKTRPASPPDGLLRADLSNRADVSRLPRLRRSGSISLLAVAAARDALAAAGLDESGRSALPVFFACTDGGVNYTSRFYAGIVEGGPGSPLLFPETVYNAPASHVAAAIGTDQEASAFVGDASTALVALAAASTAVSDGRHPAALVVAAQEADPIARRAYEGWGFAGGAGSPVPPLAEFAVGIVLGRNPAPVTLAACIEGRPFRTPSEARESLAANLDRLRLMSKTPWIPSCTGNPLEEAEALACATSGPRGPDFRSVAGEAFAAGILLHVAMAAKCLSEGLYPHCLVPSLGAQGGCCTAFLTTSHATP